MPQSSQPNAIRVPVAPANTHIGSGLRICQSRRLIPSGLNGCQHCASLRATHECAGMFETEIQGISLKLVTTPSLFSPRCADPGTLAMLSCTTFSPGDKILDLGCGYGLVGIFAAKVLGPECVFMVDNDPEAIRCASENLVINNVEGATVQVSDGLEQLEQAEFDAIRCNPPYHADFSTARRFIEKGFNRLK